MCTRALGSSKLAFDRWGLEGRGCQVTIFFSASCRGLPVMSGCWSMWPAGVPDINGSLVVAPSACLRSGYPAGLRSWRRCFYRDRGGGLLLISSGWAVDRWWIWAGRAWNLGGGIQPLAQLPLLYQRAVAGRFFAFIRF